MALRPKRPVLCVFDSGLTGIVLSQSLVDELGLCERVPQSPPPSGGRGAAGGGRGLRSLQLSLLTEGGRRVELRSGVEDSPLFYAQAIRLNWFSDANGVQSESAGPHVVAIGQCVLAQGVLTVDGPQRRATWTVPQSAQVLPGIAERGV